MTRILIAEDDPSVRKVTTVRLEHEGYEVVAVCDGEEALREMETHLPIHLVLLDVKMPKLNGYQVCRRLKDNPVTKHIPIIVFSASKSHMTQLADQCIEVGANDWIRKPFKTQDLLEKIRYALEQGGEA